MTMVNSTALYSALYRVLHCSYRLLWWWSTGDSQHQQPISYVPNSHRHIYSLSFSPRLSLHNPVHYFWQLLPLSLPRPRFHLLVLPCLSSHPFEASFQFFFSRKNCLSLQEKTSSLLPPDFWADLWAITNILPKKHFGKQIKFVETISHPLGKRAIGHNVIGVGSQSSGLCTTSRLVGKYWQKSYKNKNWSQISLNAKRKGRRGN